MPVAPRSICRTALQASIFQVSEDVRLRLGNRQMEVPTHSTSILAETSRYIEARFNSPGSGRLRLCSLGDIERAEKLLKLLSEVYQLTS